MEEICHLSQKCLTYPRGPVRHPPFPRKKVICAKLNIFVSNKLGGSLGGHCSEVLDVIDEEGFSPIISGDGEDLKVIRDSYDSDVDEFLCNLSLIVIIANPSSQVGPPS